MNKYLKGLTCLLIGAMLSYGLVASSARPLFYPSSGQLRPTVSSWGINVSGESDMASTTISYIVDDLLPSPTATHDLGNGTYGWKDVYGTTFHGALTGNADTASSSTGLAADGGNCGAGEYPLGVDSFGAVQSCTDATTEINSVVNGLGGTNLTCSSQSCSVDDVFLLRAGGTVTGELIVSATSTLAVANITTLLVGGIGTPDSALEVVSSAADYFMLSSHADGDGNILTVDSAGNLLIGGAIPGTNGAGILAMANGTLPATSPADEVQIWAADVEAGKSVLNLLNEDDTIWSSWVSRTRAYSSTTAQVIDNETLRIVRLNTEDFDAQDEMDTSVVVGTADGTSANKLIDSGAFTEAAAYYTGRTVWNKTDNTYTTVTGKDSNDQLALTADIMADTETYELFFSRFTATKAGYYQVNGSVQFDNPVDGQLCILDIYKNGVGVTAGAVTAGKIALDITATVNDIVYLAAGQYVELFAYQNSSGVRALNALGKYTFMSVHRLSD